MTCTCWSSLTCKPHTNSFWYLLHYNHYVSDQSVWFMYIGSGSIYQFNSQSKNLDSIVAVDTLKRLQRFTTLHTHGIQIVITRVIVEPWCSNQTTADITTYTLISELFVDWMKHIYILSPSIKILIGLISFHGNCNIVMNQYLL